MKVFYTASYYGKEKYQKYYDKVLSAIEETKVDLISPEKGNYMNILKPHDKDKIKDKLLLHYKAIKQGILWSDAVIIEISNEDFQLGHEATLAIQNKKPVLCLSIHEDFGKKIKSRFFFGSKYNQYNIKFIVQEFINRVRKGVLTERFNFFLSPAQLQHLKISSQKTGITKSEYLRSLIEKDLMLQKH
ncbi:ribbon-helix-helix domain-containing protein [Candidatus Dojkabacteria bacterium]|nr:ribbon-helix-helix domain-containing protein [Candidatus Dojkabacteria bacterium]